MGVPFRFIHAADLHVDSPFRGLSEAPSHVREALQASTFRAVARLVDAAIAEAVDFVVIAGDLYDSADRSLRAQLALQKEWQRLHAHGVQLFVIHGNHDPLSGQQAALRWPDSVYFFGAERVEQVPAYTRQGELAAYITGISYGTRSVTANLAAGYKARMDDSYGIALLHGNVDGIDGHDPYAPCRLDELVGAGFHYWALGHIHIRAVLHEYPHVVYAGNTQGRHAKESGAKGCYVVDVSASRETELRFVPLDSVRWLNVQTAIEGLTSEQELLDAMEDEVCRAAADCGGRSIMARFSLVGRGVLHARLGDSERLQELLEGLRERIAENGSGLFSTGNSEYGWCWISELEASTGAPIDLAALAEEDSFIGELIRESRQAESGEALQSLMEEAMLPLLGSPKLRKLVRSAMERHANGWLDKARELSAGLLAAAEPDSSASNSVGAAVLEQGGEAK
ncbi:metallophosphoesterase family protein [Paenibacillus sacheonensis]|uniref:DNA repair exonuclease n=1 Tax=Paenibacillus sacheonensis TaxID=742054 RepID=A0A7X4YLR6_9BACL|nr:DNA repair exonuclease [Paenibacillus sacheonensis]MBM7563671.1 DNA repair exonuclease SbcCD nuclease subunit [Paenibacillus sacheonensis]NBC67971.1 DNA repair exonuclease [Paenibacillus sacheonensis]